jgi:hypothetical protein
MMNDDRFLEIDPQLLHLPATRPNGADPAKLRRQIAQHGASIQGMPPIGAYRGSDGALLIFDGVTRATRAAMLRPGEKVLIEIMGQIKAPCGHMPTVGERLP